MFLSIFGSNFLSFHVNSHIKLQLSFTKDFYKEIKASTFSFKYKLQLLATAISLQFQLTTNFAKHTGPMYISLINVTETTHPF